MTQTVIRDCMAIERDAFCLGEIDKSCEYARSNKKAERQGQP